MSDLPLAGRRVLVTRAAHQAHKLSEALRAKGAEPIEVPVLEIAPPDDFSPLDRALQQLDSYDWLILTSANTVRAIVERSGAVGTRLRSPEELRVAAVGSATAEAAREAGFHVAVVPEKYVAESLVYALTAKQPIGEKILLARAAIARDVIPDALRGAGATVDVVDAYQNRMPEGAPKQLREAMAAGIDAATFTSSSSVLHLADAARAAGLEFPLAGVAAISIGPITSQTLREAGWEPAIEAARWDIPGLVEVVVQLLLGNP